VRVETGDGNDLITILGSQTPVTVVGGAGDDTFEVEGAGLDGLLLNGQEGSDAYSIDFGNLAGPVSVAESGTTGSDWLTVHGTSGDDVLTIDGDKIMLGGEEINLTGALESLAVDTGGGQDQVTVLSSPVVPLVVDGSTEAVVEGTDGPDSIQFTPGNSPEEIVATLNGASLGTFSAPTRLTAYGRGGDDEIRVVGSIAVAAWLYGGPGNDRLKGGGGKDVLLGGDEGDLLVGGSGRDLLIGGMGADRIVGNADDDILIAGFTAHDTSRAALDAIMDEWTRTDPDAAYQQRIDRLMAGVGPDGSVVLDGSTVSRDGAVDMLTGSAGLDWFWFDELDDRDRATDLKDEAFTADLDWILAQV
jgi:Ca2+-binding RTX toxin-like protein